MIQHESDAQTHISINDTNDNFNTWLNKNYISQELKNELSDKTILFLPFEGFRGTGPCFPVKTEELFTYVKKQLPEDMKKNADICIEEEDYKELALHAELIVIGSFIVTSIVLPIFTKIVPVHSP